jgi:MORN repeat protein
MASSGHAVAMAILLGAPLAVLGEEFKCPEGAKDSGSGPDQIVRWCEVNKDGRLLYHGPVWRWHRNGHLMSKENYVFGAMDGEIPSWFANGKQSSLGSYKNGKRVGPWTFWDEEGRIKVKVTYDEAGAARTDFYPSGKKLAAGSFKDGAKLGLWVYFNEDGSEKARCDFGQGLFALPDDRGCEIIAQQLDPKGFSRPVPAGSVTSDGDAIVRIAAQTYVFSTPTGWVADAKAGAKDRVPVVFFPKGSAWRQPGPNMYIRPVFKDRRTFKAVMEHEKDEFGANVAEYQEAALQSGKLSAGRDFVTKTISYKPLMRTDSPFAVVQSNTVREAIGFLDVSDEVVLVAVLACDDDSQLKASTPALSALIESLKAPNAPTPSK